MDLSATHLHLMFNHIPVIGTGFVAIVLGWGLFRHSREITSLGLALLVILALVTIPVYLTGEPTADQQEHAAWFNKDRVDDHEEEAERGLIAILVTGAVALAAIWLRRGARPGVPFVTGLAFVGTLVSAGLFALAALDGGKIRHTELRSADQVTAPVPPPR